MLSLPSPFGQLSLSWYGLFLGCAVIGGYYWCVTPVGASIGAKKRQGDDEAPSLPNQGLLTARTYALGITAALVASKLAFILVHGSQLQTGFDTLGGILGAYIILQWMSDQHLLNKLDRVSFAFFAGAAVCSLGLYFSGLDFGKALSESAMPSVTQFSSESTAFQHQLRTYPTRLLPDSTTTLSLHPTTLYDAAMAMLLALASLRIKNWSPGRKGLTLGAAYFVWVGLSAGLDSRGSMQQSMRLSAATGLICVALVALNKKRFLDHAKATEDKTE